jgi:hypothetical protein
MRFATNDNRYKAQARPRLPRSLPRLPNFRLGRLGSLGSLDDSQTKPPVEFDRGSPTPQKVERTPTFPISSLGALRPLAPE